MPITFTGLFSGFDLENAAALKRLSIGLHYYRTSGFSSAISDFAAAIRREEEEMPKNPLERSNLAEIWFQMNSKTLIKEIIDQFMLVDINDSGALLAAGVQLRHFVDPLLNTWPTMGKAYTFEQEKLWDDLCNEWRSVHGTPNTPQPNDPRMARSAALSWGSSAMIEPNPRQGTKATTGSFMLGVASTKLWKSTGVYASKTGNNDGMEEKHQLSSRESVTKFTDYQELDRKKSKKKVSRRLAPPRRKGDRVVDDGNIDFTRAKVGVEDPSKLRIFLITEKLCPNTGDFIPGSGVNRIYGHIVKWNDPISVRGLNQWRNTCLARDFGSGWNVRSGRWLQMEKKWVIRFLQRRPCTDWDRLTKFYNITFRGSTQRGGEFFVRVPGRQDEKMVEDRIAPERARDAIEYVVKLWPEYQALCDSVAPLMPAGHGGMVQSGIHRPAALDTLHGGTDQYAAQMQKPTPIGRAEIINQYSGVPTTELVAMLMQTSSGYRRHMYEKKREIAESESGYNDEEVLDSRVMTLKSNKKMRHEM